MRTLARVSALALACAINLPTLAADAATDAMQAAYAPYRVALFRTNGQSPTEAQQALGQAQQAWKGFVERFAAQPPTPYDRDPEFGITLNQVAAVYDKAVGEVTAGRLPQAHASLEQVRDLLADLRQRNGVVVFSDTMNAYHAEMERLLADGPRLLSDPQGMPRLHAHGGVLDYLARRLRAQAPPALRRDAEFDALLKDVEASVQHLQQAAFGQDTAALRDAISKVKAPYSKLFLRFG